MRNHLTLNGSLPAIQDPKAPVFMFIKAKTPASLSKTGVKRGFSSAARLSASMDPWLCVSGFPRICFYRKRYLLLSQDF